MGAWIIGSHNNLIRDDSTIALFSSGRQKCSWTPCSNRCLWIAGTNSVPRSLNVPIRRSIMPAARQAPDGICRPNAGPNSIQRNISSMADFIDFSRQAYELNRTRTLDLLANIEKLPGAQAALGWRPGPGRAHIGWQLLHIGVTEDIFASERLAQKPGKFTELWPR